MLLFLEILGIIIGVYVLTVLALLALIRLKKDGDGNLILDSTSWHFKMAYPFLKFDSYFLETLRKKGTNICSYCAKLVFMLYIGWPCILVFKILVLYIALIAFLFLGKWESFNLQKWQKDGELHITTINLPRIKGYKICPIYLLTLLIYIWSWLRYPVIIYSFTITALVAALATAMLVAICISISCLRKTESFNLALIWITDRKKRLCHHLKVVQTA